MLRVNIFIEEIATKFKKSAQEKSCVKSDKTGNGGVLCNLCVTAEESAVKSCLVCFMSYCKAHLEPHQRIPTLKKHKLIDPAENLESRICKKHDEALELFCRNDQIFVCETCKSTDHRGHKMVTFTEEAEIKKAQLDMEKTRLDQMIQVRQQKINETDESRSTSRKNAEKAKSYSEHVMTTLVDYMKRSQAELAEVTELKQIKVETEAEGFIKELEYEIKQISMQNSELLVPFANDPFINLENLLALAIPQTQVKDWSDVTLKSEPFNVNEAMAALAVTITKEIQMVCDPEWKALQAYAVDVTLDPDTAHPSLMVSEDGKQVSYSERKRNVPNKPERFNHVLNVLAKEAFLEGKYYYEVQVKDKTHWDLGVASESINRKGDVRLSPRNGYWTIWLRKGHEFTANAGPAVNIPVKHRPEKIGVFLHYEEGQVSFYDVDARALIYTFNHCNFTEKLIPFFSPCTNDGGKNIAPLIITPVQKS